MIDFAEIVLSLVVVLFAYWLLEERNRRKREAEAEAARVVSEVRPAMAYVHLEKRARFLVTLNHCGASHQLTFDGTEPSRLAVLHLALRSNQPRARQ